MNLRLLLVRHGRTDWNDQHRFQGQADVPLNDAGLSQAKALAARLSGEQVDAIYASDLQRAWDTAVALAAGRACPLLPEPGLRELDFGEWEGLTYSEIQQRYPQGLSEWERDKLETPPPGGESLNQLGHRLDAVLERISGAHSEASLLIVAHGGTLQVLLCRVLHLPLGMHWQFYLSQASLSEVRLYPEGAMLNRLNDTCHLR